MIEQKITTDFIKLESLLKLTAICSSGGEAKMVIQDEMISVNGEVCTQRGKKIRSGDLVEFQDTQIRVV
ncbi:MAG: RNA-binding S4 domain-containing protein [Lachnospiraceae bacterium]|nr:RNA-binding S4 domain-containing protein [Oscillospiraceae bacterium]MBQ5600081.1 RNA-binding S4 domain-containing protein [Lachnospiraceae bacterium]MBQ5869541.1 RNA-binding S4 domain-containing protein [Lachnospiraceae bacterium]